MPPGAPRPPGAPPPPGAPVMSNKKPPMKPGVPMKQLHWGKIPDAKIKGTIWEKDVKDEKVKLDEKKLEELFCARKAAAPGGGGGGGADGKPEKKKDEIVTLVDPKTANNTAIAISRFKMQPEDICGYLKAGKVEAFTVDQIQAVLAILPTAEDVEVCQGYDGPKALLGKAEQFFLAVAGVPRYQIRTKCMLVRVTFDERYGECEEKVLSVQKAVAQVRSSKAFKTVLEYALACGNYLNGTSNKGSAWGFKLDSLAKLKDTKTMDNSSTMMHYIAAQLEAAAGDKTAPALLLADEMPDVEAATRCIWKDETGELATIKSSLKQVQTQVKLDKIEEFTSSMGKFHGAASVKAEKLGETHAETDKALTELKAYFGEDPKTEPEELFGLLHNFIVMFEKAHKYNKTELEKKKKMEKMEAAKAAKKAAGKGVGEGQRKGLVDAVDGPRRRPGGA